MLAPTGDQFEIEGGGYRAVVTESGASLRVLEHDDFVARHSYAETPPRVEYELTEKGEALLPIIEQMRRFGHSWLVDDEPAAIY